MKQLWGQSQHSPRWRCAALNGDIETGRDSLGDSLTVWGTVWQSGGQSDSLGDSLTVWAHWALAGAGRYLNIDHGTRPVPGLLCGLAIVYFHCYPDTDKQTDILILCLAFRWVIEGQDVSGWRSQTHNETLPLLDWPNLVLINPNVFNISFFSRWALRVAPLIVLVMDGSHYKRSRDVISKVSLHSRLSWGRIFE